MNITQIENKPVIWGCAALAALLLMLSVPYLGARLLLLPGDDTREALLEDLDVSSEDLADFVASRRRALVLYDGHDVFNDMALASFAEAKLVGLATREGHAKLLDVVRWQRKSLNRSPADTYGWARLAYAYLLLEGASSDHAAQALAYSMATGPFEPRLMVSRLNSLMVLRDVLDVDVRAQIPAVMRAAWKVDGPGVEAAARAGHYDATLQTVLKDAGLQ